jgi:tetratricopeptide (TPR) repeat protein
MSRNRLPVVACLGLILASSAAAQDQALREAARLDAEQKCGEAERYYQEALTKAPPPPALLNNAGNHYLVCGQPDKARTYFERLIQINPLHANANLQLARILTEQKQGAKALEYLARVKDAGSDVGLLRAEALHDAGKHAAALTILEGLEKQANGDPRVLFLLGMTCARIGLYDRAEAAFNTVLVRHPDDFDVLFNLGRVAARAQHYDRAQRALEVAAKMRPDDIDLLLELGRVYAARRDSSRAVYVLAQARQKAPKRPDILLALARAAEDAGYYGDSALACDEYLQLRRADDIARRDCAGVYGYTGTRLEEGVRELTWYVQNHPDDPVGYYDLAQFSWRTHPQESLDELSAALRLNPNFVPAHHARAWLLHRLGRTAESLPDLQAAVRISPGNSQVLDQLGLAYLSLDQPSAAEKVLRQALAVSPEYPEVLMHLGRALMALGREEEGQRYLEKFQKVRPQHVRDPRKEAGMIESATLPAGERTKREIERLRRDARSHPGDPELQLHLAQLLLADGRAEEAAGEFRTLLTMHAESRIWSEAGTSLVRSEQYELAREFLERAAAESPTARLDLAIALFFTDGPKEALQVIEKVPAEEQTEEYLLMRARILDAAGRIAEAEKLLQQGLHHSTFRPQVVEQTALLLLRHDRKTEALDILGHAIEANPDNADLLLMKAIVLGLMDQFSESDKMLKEIESRWPEWDRPYLVHGVLLERGARPKEARQKLEIAIALGSLDLAGRCALARLAASPSTDPRCACQAELYQLLLSSCDHD